MKEIFNVIMTCILGGVCSPAQQAQPPVEPITQAQEQQVKFEITEILSQAIYDQFYSKSLSGNYLASQFAQKHHDWEKAVEYITPVVQATPDDPAILNKSMVLSIGSGNFEDALVAAKKISKIDGQQNALAELMRALDYFRNKDYAAATNFIETIPQGSLSDFVLPLIKSWAHAASGDFNVEALNQNTIHIYHAILIAEYLDKSEAISMLLSKALMAQGLSLQDIERVADVYAHIGESDTAIELYERLFAQWPENRLLGQKLESFKTGEEIVFVEKVASPEEGLSRSLYDMGRLLFQEKSDESARVFAHMALFVDPNMTNAKLLLGYITARNNHYDDAIGYYRSVNQDDPQYAESIRLAADLMESSGKYEDALNALNTLFKTHKDIEALIQIGDIQRRHENFKEALIAYNKAADILGDPLPPEYWQLLYVRGISHERNGNWKAAEKDLIMALEYQPAHPLILNYLGYAWADQGINLEKSLEYIRKAASLQSTDGYITDSLGWVLYKMGEYKQAVPHLERAVELLPYDSVINDHLGDAYWKVGRKLEARFQWIRAKNYAEDDTLISDIEYKLQNGLQSRSAIKAASSDKSDDVDAEQNKTQ